MALLEKTTLPPAAFDKDTAFSAPAAAMKAAGASALGTAKRVSLDKLEPLPGFNVRVKGSDTEFNQHVEELAASIIANGYYEHKPLAVIAVAGKDETLFIYDGETRFEAAKLAVERGAPIKDLPVVVAPAGTTIEDLTIALVNANDGNKLNPVEMGAAVKRLMSYGMSKEDVSAKIGKTVRHIDNLLVLAGAPSKVRGFVGTGQIAAAKAVEIMRRHKDNPASGAKIISEAVSQAQSSGHSKATPKTMAAAGPKMKKTKLEFSLPEGGKFGDSLKQIAAAIRNQVKHDPKNGDVLAETGSIVVYVEVLAPPAPEGETTAAGKPGRRKAAETTVAAAGEAAASGDAPPADAASGVVEPAVPTEPSDEEAAEAAMANAGVEAADPNGGL